MSRINNAWDNFWQAQAGRRFLWLPVLFAAGIAAYFSWPSEPPRAGLLIATVAFALRTAFPPRRGRLVCAALLLCFAGASWASIYTAWHAPVLITQEMTPRPLSGVVDDIERVENGVRITLSQPEIRGLEPQKTPRRVRLTVRLKPENNLTLPRIGERISLLAGLLPPMGPAMPGGFDFARYFYFRDIGAVGYGLPPWTQQTPAAQDSIAERFAQWRLNVTERIITTLGPEHGPIAAGLITGEDRAIREADFKALRASNLYHIIAISGGHMAVIAGVIFVGLRLLFLLLPYGYGQRAQAKSVAAAITLVMITLYLYVTGLPISAVRAYVMIALMLLAVLLRREVDAMRSLMLTALIMLLFDPSDLLEPGFQLSFVATLAIVALAEATWLRPSTYEEPSYLRLAWRALVGMVMISLVAEAATSFLVLHMFNTVALYGVLANAIATPLVAVLLMPSVALFFLLLPFGLEGFALQAMDYGISAMMTIATTIHALPHALQFFPSPPGWGVGLFVMGLLWLCLLRGRVRLLAVLWFALAGASLLTIHLPDVLVGPNVRQIALRTGNGYALVRGRPDSLIPELWGNALGYEQLPLLKAGTPVWRCDRMGCLATVDGRQFAFPHDPVALAEDCVRADMVLSTLRTRRCKARLVSSYSLARHGVHAVWLRGAATHVETSAGWQGMRPWSVGWHQRNTVPLMTPATSRRSR